MRRFRLIFPFIAGTCLLSSAGIAAGAKTSAPPLYEKGMVSAADPRAALAGAEMLRKGGSATDAALATMVALTIVEPQSSGIGGGGFLISDDGHGQIETFDGRETAPAAANPDWFKRGEQFLPPSQAVPGGLSVGVPGNVALMEEAHKRHGKLAWKTLFAPAIKLAREGFAITPRLHDYLVRYQANPQDSEEVRQAHYLKSGGPVLTAQSRLLYYAKDGTALPIGTIIRNPDLAKFLAKLAAKGPGAFYRGSNAAAIANAVSTAPRNPAPMTVADITNYKVKARAPVCTAYRSYRLCGMGPPSSGATTVFGILGMLERFNLSELGKDSPAAWHLIAEAERLAYADRERYLADSDFVQVPVAGLIAADYLAARSQLIALDKTMVSAPAGQPAGAPLAASDGITPEVPSTSHFVAVDRTGAVASFTSTIEGPFGSGLMVNGYFLNNQMTDFSLVPAQNGKSVANRVEAGKRPRSSMSPTLVYGPDGRFKLAIGAAGGPTIPAQVVKALIGIIDWQLTAQQAIALPMLIAPAGDTVFIEQGSTLEAMIPSLNALGHAKVLPRALPLKSNAIEVIDGKLTGAADPRSEGQAIAE